MLTRLAQTLCRLFAAFVCLMCVGEVFGCSPHAVELSGDAELRAAPMGDQLDGRSQESDSRDEREENDDEDDDIDGSRHTPWSGSPSAEFVCERSCFPRARAESAPDKSHHSLDPRPPRRA